jgi:hypothetical protein
MKEKLKKKKIPYQFPLDRSQNNLIKNANNLL